MRAKALSISEIEAERLFNRFWSKVDTSGKCWAWTANSLKGRGQFKFRGQSVYAPRIAFALTVGPLAAGLSVCHHCDNPACVRPSHLFLGTDADNTKDRDEKKRQARGESHGRAAITLKDVELIRAKISLGIKLTEIARLGYSYTTIVDIKRGRSWGDNSRSNRL